MACACFFWKVRRRLCQNVLILPYPNFNQKGTAACLTPFTCLQGSVWRIGTAGRCQQDLRLWAGGIRTSKRLLLAHQAFHMSFSRWRYAERPVRPASASESQHVQKGERLDARMKTSESRATAVLDAAGLLLSVSLSGSAMPPHDGTAQVRRLSRIVFEQDIFLISV